ncbi:hypothetical protein C0Q73_10165 [Klebsiella pneumoniae]|nr:hypothetical protein [Klebsiella pneumoniae]
MKSEPLTVNQLFQNRRQYCVPFYQRAYVWTLRDWICPYISRHLLSLNPLLARCRRYSRGER